ncbi:GW domain-containing glycosaminoglycan-binding protein [Listeria monocytogenes]|uniref:GW domain-containing glycosaminoglycan-binding protein n=1 Tax=Listeria monocytogenes TaxID=1639 RepID=UPI001EFD184F|nr:GW domain-containing glycosaminoglycan-binding protein [Listeria monocytogenes]
MPSTDIAYSRTGKITNTSGHAVWTQPCGQINSTLKGPASDYLNKEITIWRKVENKRGTYYQFSETKTPNIKAWLDARAITLYDQYILMKSTIRWQLYLQLLDMQYGQHLIFSPIVN